MDGAAGIDTRPVTAPRLPPWKRVVLVVLCVAAVVLVTLSLTQGGTQEAASETGLAKVEREHIERNIHKHLSSGAGSGGSTSGKASGPQTSPGSVGASKNASTARSEGTGGTNANSGVSTPAGAADSQPHTVSGSSSSSAEFPVYKTCPGDIGGKGPAIVSLVASRPSDIHNVALMASSLRHLQDASHPAPLLIFHEADFPEDAKSKIQQAAQVAGGSLRPVEFHLLDFTSPAAFPAGFSEAGIKPSGSKRSPWGYHQMMRFWMTKVWEHPAIQRFSSVMRMDSDSCLTAPSQAPIPSLCPRYCGKDSVPGDAAPCDIVYNAHSVHDGKAPKLQKTILAYVRKHRIEPANADMWAVAKKPTKRLPNFDDNWEITSVPFMVRPDVRAFNRALSEEAPLGIFRFHWGDNVVRYYVMALFAKPEQVLVNRPAGYEHSISCPGVAEH